MISSEWSWDTWQGKTMLSPTVTSMLKGDTITRVGSTNNKENKGGKTNMNPVLLRKEERCRDFQDLCGLTQNAIDLVSKNRASILGRWSKEKVRKGIVLYTAFAKESPQTCRYVWCSKFYLLNTGSSTYQLHLGLQDWSFIPSWSSHGSFTTSLIVYFSF